MKIIQHSVKYNSLRLFFHNKLPTFMEPDCEEPQRESSLSKDSKFTEKKMAVLRL